MADTKETLKEMMQVIEDQQKLIRQLQKEKEYYRQKSEQLEASIEQLKDRLYIWRNVIQEIEKKNEES